MEFMNEYVAVAFKLAEYQAVSTRPAPIFLILLDSQQLIYLNWKSDSNWDNLIASELD